MNEEIEMMRASAVNSLLERKDTIVVCSVAAIYGLSDPNEYRDLAFTVHVGEPFKPHDIANKLIQAQYQRNDMDLKPGCFTIKGDVMDIYPPNGNNFFIRIYSDFDEVSEIDQIRPTTGEVLHTVDYFPFFPAHEHASGNSRIEKACKTIREELKERLAYYDNQGMLLESERLKQRTEHDLDSLSEFGMCAGIENYARHFDGRKEGETPYTLFDYFPKDFLLFIDESHVTIPQVGGMYLGDRSRKETLVQYGFRLPSALDNRPLKLEEFASKIKNVICTSATPGDYELEKTNHQVVEQIIRPTGLLDPIIEVRFNTNNPVYDLMKEIQDRIKKNERVLVVTLTVKDAENLTDFFKTHDLKVAYLQHEILTLQRTEIIYKLRKGIYDVLVGINLLREGLDIPEVSLIAILDADKQGFLRSERSLTQIAGRAARNASGKVIMYCDDISDSMDRTIKSTQRRRKIQETYNKEHGIVPKTILKPIQTPIHMMDDDSKGKRKEKSDGKMTQKQTQLLIKNLTSDMNKAAKALDFEEAARLRDEILELKATLTK